MWGLKGTEDLVGGTLAIFNLETALQIMNARPTTGVCGRGVHMLDCHQNSGARFRRVAIYSSIATASGNSTRSCTRPSRRRRLSVGGTGSRRATMWNIIVLCFMASIYKDRFAFGNQPGSFNAGAQGGVGRSDGVMLTYHSPVLDVRGIYDELRSQDGSTIFSRHRVSISSALT